MDWRISMTTFVLVHGAWHGGWCWRDVAAPLREQGHTVFTPSLSGMGEHSHTLSHLPGKTITLDTHVADIVSLIEIEALHDVVLVGHSYGGLIITGVAEALRETHALARLIYVDALVPRDGEGWAAFHTPEQIVARHASAKGAGDGQVLPAPDASVFGIEDAAQRAWVQRSLRPHPYGAYLSALTLPTDAAAKLPRLYIDCVKPFYSNFNGLKPRLQADVAWQYVSVEAGHDIMVSNPAALVKILLEA
jgi:pimeloyl-ACP methyl ester carboxylesterase